MDVIYFYFGRAFDTISDAILKENEYELNKWRGRWADNQLNGSKGCSQC